jgi:hypothetical protein
MLVYLFDFYSIDRSLDMINMDVIDGSAWAKLFVIVEDMLTTVDEYLF